jgi:hypothetical protein
MMDSQAMSVITSAVRCMVQPGILLLLCTLSAIAQNQPPAGLPVDRVNCTDYL